MIHHDEKQPQKPFDIALQRWFHAITGHFFFTAMLGALSLTSVLLVIGCFWLFAKTGGVIFLIGSIPFAALSGGIWAPMHGMNRQLQFDHTNYLFKELWKHTRQSFVHGAALGVLLLFVCIVLYLPILMSLMLQEPIPFGVVCIIMIGSVLLPVVADYTFYQISRWEISLFAAISNSFLLIFRVGWPSVATCLVWVAYFILTIFFPYTLVPLSLFIGLTSVLNLTTQALYSPKIDELMSN